MRTQWVERPPRHDKRHIAVNVDVAGRPAIDCIVCGAWWFIGPAAPDDWSPEEARFIRDIARAVLDDECDRNGWAHIWCNCGGGWHCTTCGKERA